MLNRINNALERCLRDSCVRQEGRVTISHEPLLVNHADRLPGANLVKTRADIGVTLPNGDCFLIDTSVAKPDAVARPQSATIAGAGAAADERVKTKMTKYNKNWKLHQGTKILIAAAEAGGRLHPDLIDFIKRSIKASCSDDIMTYVYKLKASMQRISVALRRTTSCALMELERRAKAYPSVALGAATQP